MFLPIQIAAVLVVAALDAGVQVGSMTRADLARPLVAGEGYQGVIFPTLPFNPKMYGADGSWGPSASDVGEFERLLRAALEGALRDPRSIVAHGCQPGESAAWAREYERRRKAEIKIILETLSAYRRQYAGVAMGSRRTLVVNFFPGAPSKIEDWHSTWRHEWVNVLGGGTGYWGISFDVQEKRFHDFYANSPR